jgi:hypothetical protein
MDVLAKRCTESRPVLYVMCFIPPRFICMLLKRLTWIYLTMYITVFTVLRASHPRSENARRFDLGHTLPKAQTFRYFLSNQLRWYLE